jgi:hypothetical protein
MGERFNKSEFIRRFPNLKPAEVVEEAAKLGEEISPGTIWTLRSADKRKAEGKVGKAAKKTAKAAKKVEGNPLNKSAFIRKYPKLSAAQIVEKAAALGAVITPNTIYTLRSADKKAEGKSAKKPAIDGGSKSVQTPVPITGRASIAFDPSDPEARRFIARALAART